MLTYLYRLCCKCCNRGKLPLTLKLTRVKCFVNNTSEEKFAITKCTGVKDLKFASLFYCVAFTVRARELVDLIVRAPRTVIREDCRLPFKINNG